MARKTYRLFVLALALAPLTACGANDDEAAGQVSAALIEDGVDGNDATSSAQSLTRALLGDDMQTMDYPPSSNGTLMVPSDCVQKTVSGNVREFVLDGCSGPFGLARVSGKITMTLTPSTATQWNVAVVSEGLTIGQTVADYEADAVVTLAGVERTMQWTGHLTGTTARGRQVQRDGTWTIVWTSGSECVGIEGSAVGTISGRSLKTVVTGFSRCKGSCPEAGGLLTVTDQDTGESASVAYDGSSEATFTGVKGRQGTVTLLCGEI
jgi:hypothetical protein